MPTPQSFHHWTLARQVDHLVTAREAEPDLGFMARMLALCSLPRTNPGRRKELCPAEWTLHAGDECGRTQQAAPLREPSPALVGLGLARRPCRTNGGELVLGNSSLSEFMRRLDIYSDSGGSRGMRTRLRNQMHRLFNVSCSTSSTKMTEQNSASM